MKNFFEMIAKGFAKFYNSMPNQLKIAIMVSTSMLFATWLSTFATDLKAIPGLNQYAQALVQWAVAIITVIVNLLQQYAVQKGTEALANEGDKTTIRMLKAKVATNAELASSSNEK